MRPASIGISAEKKRKWFALPCGRRRSNWVQADQSLRIASRRTPSEWYS